MVTSNLDERQLRLRGQMFMHMFIAIAALLFLGTVLKPEIDRPSYTH